MSGNSFIVAECVRVAGGGYIANLRWPYGPQVCGTGEVVFTKWTDVLIALSKAADLKPEMENAIELALKELG
jgi:hypothetical protein